MLDKLTSSFAVFEIERNDDRDISPFFGDELHCFVMDTWKMVRYPNNGSNSNDSINDLKSKFGTFAGILLWVNWVLLSLGCQLKVYLISQWDEDMLNSEP